jgi:hypothetical protein
MPVRYAQTLKALAADPDSTVRILLARRLHQATIQADNISAGATGPNVHDVDRESGGRAITEVLAILTKDRRHTVRRAASGLGS